MYDCFHGFPVHDVHENGDAHGLHDYVDNDVPMIPAVRISIMPIQIFHIMIMILMIMIQ